MKKLLLVAFLALTSMSAFTQITFTAAMMPEIGDTARYQYMDTTGFDVGTDGSGVTWDYSSFADSVGAFRLEYVDPASTPFGGTFNQAGTIASTNGSGDFYYYQSSADSFYIVGEANQFTLNSASPYTNPLVIYDFPFAPGDTIRDNLSGQYTASGFPAWRTGADTIYHSGDGTLMLPDTVLNNVTRLFKRYSYKDSSNIIGLDVINMYNIWTYEWYNAGNEEPVMVYWHQDVSLAGNPTEDTWVYYRVFGDTMISAVEPQNELVTQVEVYPNPFSNETRIQFELANTTSLKVELYNLLGERLQVVADGVQSAGSHILTLNAEGLENGTYLLRFENEETAITRKVVVIK